MTDKIPRLGHHFELCMDVEDMSKTIEFYESIGFKIYTGGGEKGWCTMTDGLIHFAFFGDNFIEKEFGTKYLLNYRGGNVDNTTKFLKEMGVEFSKLKLQSAGIGDAIFKDLNGHVFYLDTSPEEERIDVPEE